ncbi:hypothetical protein PMIN02_002763 [Paraphaeosphaeria minitans]
MDGDGLPSGKINNKNNNNKKRNGDATKLLHLPKTNSLVHDAILVMTTSLLLGPHYCLVMTTSLPQMPWIKISPGPVPLCPSSYERVQSVAQGSAPLHDA